MYVNQILIKLIHENVEKSLQENMKVNSKSSKKKISFKLSHDFLRFRYERVMGRPSWAEKLLNKTTDAG